MAITRSHAKLFLDQTEPQLHQTIQTDAEVVTMECQPIQFRCSETNDFRHHQNKALNVGFFPSPDIPRVAADSRF